MASRTPEEIRAQREVWLARKAARAAGEIPPEPPAETPAEPEAQPVERAASEQPATRRTPDEIRAQREAFLAKKAAKAAGGAETPASQPEAVAAAATVEKPRPAPQPKAAAAAAPAPVSVKSAPEPAVDPVVTRREFLNYAWLASLGLFAIETVGLSLWFAFPNFKEGQFGGAFPIGQASSVLPEVNSEPVAFTDGKFWLVNLDTEGPNGEPRKGVMAIYKVCTHLGCLYEWVPMTDRFECPCHGSKFAKTGDYLDGPARRSLDRFVIQAVAADGTIKQTDAEGNPLIIDGDEQLIVDTGQRILGQPVTA